MSELKNKTILVTGGAGFIGSHLCDKLIDHGAKVICFDNFFSGKKENIVHLERNPLFVFVEGDTNKLDDIKQVFSQYPLDYIFHYAAVLGVKRVSENPLLVLPDINGIRNILQLASKYKIKKVIFASSSEAYGYSTDLPLREDSDKKLVNHQNEHIHLYALIKLLGEKIMKIYNDFYKLPTCSLRFFNVYGPRQESSAYGFVIGVFIKQILDNKPPIIFGDGYQTRDFIYIDDNIRLAIKALLTDKTNGQTINIGTGRQTTVIDLAERLIRISGKNLKPHRVEERKYEIKYRTPDITKMKELLGDTIDDKLDDNLKKTYQWYLEKTGK